MSVPLSRNWMVPAAVAKLGESVVVVASKLTPPPNSEGFGVVETVVVVSAGVTICRPAPREGPPESDAVLPRTSGLVLVNVAVTGCAPTARLESMVEA